VVLSTIGPPFYGPVMGIAGLGIAWRIASGLIGVPPLIGEVFVALAFALFILISLLFISKVALRPDSLAELWNDNRAILFVPMIPTSLLLLSIGARPYDIGFATLLWQIATPFNLIFAIVIVGRWLFDDHELTMVTPAWLFPVVGNGVVPIAGVPLGFVSVGWAFFSIGFVLWIVTFVLLFIRFVLGEPLAKAARPTVLILISPPATFFIAYLELTSARLDLLSYSMIYFSLFLLAVFLLNGKWVFRASFSIASWSLTFPMAALTIASLLFYRATSWSVAQWTAVTLLGLTTIFVISVTVLGLRATFRNMRRSALI
jgi:tellurite resistance protein